MSERAERLDLPGPFRVEHLQPKSRYELSDGHPVYCAPTGGDGARNQAAGTEVLDTDPAVDEAGVDAGFALSKQTLRAPDIAVGHVPDKARLDPGRCAARRGVRQRRPRRRQTPGQDC